MDVSTETKAITYVTRAEAATILRRDIRTVDRYRKAGSLTTYRRPGVGSVELDRAEVEKLAVPVPVGAAQSAD